MIRGAGPAGASARPLPWRHFERGKKGEMLKMDKTITFSEDWVTIFIANLPFRLAEADIQSLLAPHGAVKKMRLLIHPESGQSQGICFAEMPPQAAKSAIAALDGHEYAGRVLSVRLVTKEDAEDTQPI